MLIEREIETEIKIILKGVAEIIPPEDLKSKLRRSRETKTPLRIKLGLDPSAPDIHLGHAVVLRKLHQFQKLGHLAVLIVGDFTGMVGDPSNRSEARKSLTKDEVRKNAATYVEQVCQILDPERTEVVYNSEHLSKLDMYEMLSLASRFTVARMLERDDFAKRYANKKPISIVEFLYPLLQGFDSIVVRADVELGGTDQKFNLLVGRELQREYGQEPQTIITMPLLEGTDGVQKMSKSLGNYVGIAEDPAEIFGKVMSIPDEMITRYFRLTTDINEDEISAIEKGLEESNVHPGETKRRLGREIIKLYYGEKEATEAEHIFNLKFKPGYSNVSLMPESDEKQADVAEKINLPRTELKEGKIWIVKLLRISGCISTNSEGRRLIQQQAVEINGEVVDDVNLEIGETQLQDLAVRVGKRRFFRISIGR